MSATRIMGFDPSTTSVGWCLLVVDEDDSYIECQGGTIKVPQSMALERRLAQLYEKIDETIFLHYPNVVAVETPFVGKNPKTAIAGAQGMTLVVLAAQRQCEAIPLAFYSPAAVKMAATGYGNATKEMVANAVAEILGVGSAHFTSLDETDAHAVAICHHHEIQHAAVLERIDRP